MVKRHVMLLKFKFECNMYMYIYIAEKFKKGFAFKMNLNLSRDWMQFSRERSIILYVCVAYRQTIILISELTSLEYFSEISDKYYI